MRVTDRHRRIFWAVLILSSVLHAQPAAHVTVRDETFHSTSLNRDMKYRIVLPAGYDVSSQRYPVIYLLHGLAGSYVDWETRTRLDEVVASYPLIVVMPDAGDSWYTNSITNPQDKFEDYIAKDLIAQIDENYRTIQARYARAIGGLSMGGYGAAKFALKYPQTWIFAASFSGALDITNPSFKIPFGEKYNQQVLEIYGPAGSATREQNNIYALARKADPERLPFLWIVCGTEDGLLGQNHQFIDLLAERKIPHFYAESAGAHTWEFWDEQLPSMLAAFMRRYLRAGGTQPFLPLPPPRAASRPQPRH